MSQRSAPKNARPESLPRCESVSPLPHWVPPQLTQLTETAPSGPNWLHEIKLDGFRMSARIERGRARLLTRTGLDWSGKYPSIVAALAKVRAKTAYLDGELCGVGNDGLPSFSQTQAASDGEHGVDSSTTLSIFCTLTGETSPACPLSNARGFLSR
jgi:ATP-dependent DNA ligase